MFWIIALFILTILHSSITREIKHYIKILSIQGLLLFFIIIYKYSVIFEENNAINYQNWTFFFLIIETLLIKTMLIPLFLYFAIKKTSIYTNSKRQDKKFLMLFLTICIILVSFIMISNPVNVRPNFIHLYFGTALATILTGLILIIFYKRLTFHIVGYIILENGIFLLTLSTRKEIPLIINTGILMDVLGSIFILTYFLVEINRVFQTTNTEKLIK